MIWIEKKYINLLRNSLRNFKWQSSDTANCSCPICGDSSKNKLKARFYFLNCGTYYNVYCHNCHFSASFKSFLRTYNPALFKDFWIEVLKEQGKVNQLITHTYGVDVGLPKSIVSKAKPVIGLKKVSQLSDDHIAKKYVMERKIPTPYHSRLFYAPKFMKWINENYISDKFDEEVAKKHDGPRLVIPFYNEAGKMVVCQARALNDDPRRYFSIVIDEDCPIKAFNADVVDFKKRFYITEGPIDAMFIPNCTAIGGSSSNLLDNIPFIYKNGVMIYDNDKRNIEVVKQINKTIKHGLKVFIWPDDIPYKDINEWYLSGETIPKMKRIIDRNTFEGLKATARLTEWSKC